MQTEFVTGTMNRGIHLFVLTLVSFSRRIGDVLLVWENIILYSFHQAVNLDMERSLNETGYQVLRVSVISTGCC